LLIFFFLRHSSILHQFSTHNITTKGFRKLVHFVEMLEHLTPWSPTTKVTNKVEIDDLVIEFKRTIRVPDNNDTNELPPDEGSFPLYKVDDYAEELPLNMAQKGGLFIPMYRMFILMGLP
jgi:hypothetical protein